MSDESVKQFWDHIKTDVIFNQGVLGLNWDKLLPDDRNAIDYIYHMAIGVMAENRR